MVQYKLYYFFFRGLGEPIRMMFHMANIPFEDIRVPSIADLKFHADIAVLGKLPVLSVDGQLIPQSNSICRYVARKVGLAGKSDYEVALADAISEQFVDFFWEWRPFRMVNFPYGNGSDEEKSKLKEEVMIPAAKKFAKFMVEYLKKSSTGFVAGFELTYTDLMLAEWTHTFGRFFPEIVDEFPELEEHKKKVYAIPALKKWLKQREDSDI